MNKNSRTGRFGRLLPGLALLSVLCMGTLLLYVWVHYEDLRSEQAYRQMWYLNQKRDTPSH